MTARVPATVLSFYVPLPFDTGLPDGDTTARVELDTGPLEGWRDEDVAPWLGQSLFHGQEVWPTSTLIVRRTAMWEVSPKNELKTVSEAFPEEFIVDGGADVPEDDSPVVHRSVVHVLRLRRSPVQGYTNDWAWQQFLDGLDWLNEYLFLTAWAARSPIVGPLHLLDLPPAIAGFHGPLRPVADTPSPRDPFVMANHSRVPGQTTPLSAGQRALLSDLLARASEPGERPFMPVVEFLLSAERALWRGRTAQAVVEAGTGVELLVNTTIREALADKPEELARVMRQTYRQRATGQFASIAGFSSDVERAEDAFGRWWRTGYRLRNRVAHEGYTPSHEEAAVAVDLADRLVELGGEAYGRELDAGS